MPAIAVGTAAIATYAEILRMSTFCCIATLPSAACTSELSMLVVAGDAVGGLDVVVEHVAHVPPHLDRDQVVVVGADALQRQRQRGDGPAQLDDLPLEQVDALDVGVRWSGEKMSSSIASMSVSIRSVTSR